MVCPLTADAQDRLFISAIGRTAPTLSLKGQRSIGTTAIWRFDPATSQWARHSDLQGDTLAGALRDGRVVTSTASDSSLSLRVFTPGSGWKLLAQAPAVTAVAVVADELYAIVDAVATQPRTIARLSAVTGEVVATVATGGIGNPVGLQSDSSGLLLVVTKTFTPSLPLTLTPPYTLYRGDPRQSAAFIPIASGLNAYPFASAANGSHLTTSTNNSAPRFRKADGTSSEMTNAGLSPRAACGDPVFVTGSWSVYFDFCNGPRTTPLDEPTSATLRASSGATQYFVSSNGTTLLLRTLVANTATTVVDLMPALVDRTTQGYTYKPYRLAAAGDASLPMVLLVHQFTYGTSVTPQLIAIDVAKRTATALDAPAVIASDIAIGATGHIYLTTHFGEVLRRDASSGAWSTFGHLSSAHVDLHPVVDRYEPGERLAVYGPTGVAWSQGKAARAEEFHHIGLGHYFLTANTDEAASLRNAAGQGWLATGESFPVIADAPWTSPRRGPGPQPVCRFYGSINPGPNSHFYTLSALECSALKALAQRTPASEPRWNYEGIAFHAVGTSARSFCASTEQIVYRFFNGGSARGIEPNHRFVSGAGQKATMSAAGWTLEDSAWCVPHDGLTRSYVR